MRTTKPPLGAGLQIDNGVDKPMSPALIAGSDSLWASRLRALMSVDDLVAEALALLASRGVLDNTYVVHTSDHGYHLGERRAG